MNKKYIYLGIVIAGIGAISYMYYLSDIANKKSDSDTIDGLLVDKKIQ